MTPERHILLKKHMLGILDRHHAFAALAFALLLAPGVLPASENGVNSGPIGAEDFMTGALPPKGFYYLNYATFYSSRVMKDKNSKTVPGSFSIDAPADINRFVYVTGKKFLGADYAFQVIVPLVHLDLKVTTPGGTLSSVNTGVGDVVITPLILGWHRKNFHWVGALDFFTGAGSYQKTRIANTGKHYRSLEFASAFTYLSDHGFEVSSKFMYDVNFRNGATDYKTGQEFHADHLVGIHRGPVQFGLNGYSYIQTTDDLVGQRVVEGNRGRFFGVGPAFGFEYQHMNFAIKYHREIGAENRFSGDRVWFKIAIPVSALLKNKG
jgi:hypothetical protein